MTRTFFFPGISMRDAMLVLLGATAMHFFVLFFPANNNDLQTIVVKTDPPANTVRQQPVGVRYPQVKMTATLTVTTTALAAFQTTTADMDDLKTTRSKITETVILHHAPGYTLFRNLYMSDGTLFIVTDDHSSFPNIRMMTSTGLPADNSPQNEAAREPTERDMAFLTAEEAEGRWGIGGDNRVVPIEGNTVLYNDPTQFLRHYYHFVAELWFGVQAFWHGSFSKSTRSQAHEYQLFPSSSTPPIPEIHRAIFANSNADGWRDSPGFNAYFLRAAYPSLTVECQEDWEDRIRATAWTGWEKQVDRAWVFPLVLLVDRSASFRGSICGSQTQRTASEAHEYMRSSARMMGERVGGWWEPVRAAVLRFAGTSSGVSVVQHRAFQERLEGMSKFDSRPVQMPGPEGGKVVVTYISRQGGGRRKLTAASHESLVKALEELAERKQIELILMEAEKLTKDEQLSIIARTTILLGVHGNGLTHLVFMPPTRYTTVIEMFYPGGFAHDYHWTSRALGFSHFAVWNDTYYTHPNEPGVDYPEGFQENYIPVHGPAVVEIIEGRLEGRL